jgi:hypothetical protein
MVKRKAGRPPNPPEKATTQLSFRIPNELIALADELAELERESRPGSTCPRTEALRMAMARGLPELIAQHRKAGKKR